MLHASTLCACRSVGVVGAALAIVVSPVAWGAEVVGEFAATCETGYPSYEIPGVPSPGDVVQRAEVRDAADEGVLWDVADRPPLRTPSGSAALRLTTGDTEWRMAASGRGRFGEPIAGDEPPECPSAHAVQMTAFRVPTAPASYSGRSSPHSLNENTAGSTVGVRVPGHARYVADVLIDGGSLQFAHTDGESGGWQTKVVTSSGQVALGSRPAGVTVLDGIAPATLTPVNWTITIRPLPVRVRFVSPLARMMRSGRPARFGFSAEGDTRVSARALDSSGATVRELVDLSVARGEHELLWNARDDSGRDVPDGDYTLRITTRDPSGLGSSAPHRVTVDNTPPALAVLSQRIAPTRPIALSISESRSGLVAHRITWNGRQVASLVAWTPDGISRFRAPSGRFDAGMHRIALAARDGAGNTSRLSAQVRVPGPALGRPAITARARLVRVGALSRVTDPVRVDVLLGGRRVAGCRTRAQAGTRFVCRARIGTSARGAQLRVRIQARSTQTRATHRISRVVRIR